MAFSLPDYTAPDFATGPLARAPLCTFAPVTKAGVAPDNYHGTSVFPEYFNVAGHGWILARRSRMDCVAVLAGDGPRPRLDIKEFRRLEPGDMVALGRTEDGEDGIHVHTGGFHLPGVLDEKFAFRTSLTRETSFSIDYDELFDLLRHERDHGCILWVMGPAVVFDSDARAAFTRLMDNGCVHGLLAGNALATHDIEGSIFKTALGQGIYTKRRTALGHYKHLDALNTVRRAGSIRAAMDQGLVRDGIMHTAERLGIPYVLAGSIRDDGPLPEVTADAYAAQDAMRALARKATTVVCLATQLHTIATGNMTPSYQVMDDGRVRPVYFYSVDMSEFAVSKLADRGSLTARPILTNVQDFVVLVDRGLRRREVEP